MELDFSSAQFLRDPYPVYSQLRQEAPIVWDQPSKMWIISAYEDVSALLRDRRLGRAIEPDRAAPPILETLSAFHRLDEHSLFDKEPPEHTRLKSLVQSVFTPRRAEALRPKIQSTADELLEAALEHESFDLLADYAVPLPVYVISDLLGIPQADRGRLRPWSAAIVAMYELEHTCEQERRAVEAAAEFWDYLGWLAEERRRDPQDDLISALAGATEPGTGARLSEPELIANCILLLNAGHEATVNGFGNGMLALFKHPDQLGRLRGDLSPDLVRQTVEEMLRFDTPLQLFKRWVRDDLDYKGIQFKERERVALLFGSANRDPKRFPHPAKLDIARVDNPHLAFGAGTHYCLGAPLARLELAISLDALLRRAPGLVLIEEPERRESFVIRGLVSLKCRASRSVK